MKKKQSYMAPAVECLNLRVTHLLTMSHKDSWSSGQGGTNPDVETETGGNLGGDGSEITGAKKFDVWNEWDDE